MVGAHRGDGGGADRQHREHAALAKTMPLHVVTAENLGLRGALVCAAR